jgi:hypothetical protein
LASAAARDKACPAGVGGSREPGRPGEPFSIPRAGFYSADLGYGRAVLYGTRPIHKQEIVIVAVGEREKAAGLNVSKASGTRGDSEPQAQLQAALKLQLNRSYDRQPRFFVTSFPL